MIMMNYQRTQSPLSHYLVNSQLLRPEHIHSFFLVCSIYFNEENINPTQLDERAYCSLISKRFVLVFFFFWFLNHLISAYGSQHLKKTSAAIVDVNIVRKRKTRKAHNKKKGKKNGCNVRCRQVHHTLFGRSLTAIVNV